MLTVHHWSLEWGHDTAHMNFFVQNNACVNHDELHIDTPKVVLSGREQGACWPFLLTLVRQWRVDTSAKLLKNH